MNVTLYFNVTMTYNTMILGTNSSRKILPFLYKLIPERNFLRNGDVFPDINEQSIYGRHSNFSINTNVTLHKIMNQITF